MEDQAAARKGEELMGLIAGIAFILLVAILVGYDPGDERTYLRMVWVWPLFFIILLAGMCSPGF